ncbi:ROK family transcriptional regulator [Bacteroides propionicifaciens]|uniref:ROK family transcriptional regulator n=1 Tax=Bacteroides propionicifaciens TaxID=392838 RepID=UPI00037905D3|nr:ROK family transcriptional regulator [Bacteroides propionicifaciens]
MRHQLLQQIEKGSKNALMKKRIITHYIYNGNSTITDLAKELDLSIPTVTKFITEMTDEGFINDYGKLETSGGRHPSLYGLNPDSGYFIGVELNRDALNIALINFKGDLIDSKRGIYYHFDNNEKRIDDLVTIIRDYINQLNLDHNKILNINVSIAGRVDPDNGYSYSNYSFEKVSLAEILTKKLSYPVSIDNDTRAIAFGEFMKGAVENEKNIIFINLSWGIGMGIIINGKLYTGKSGFSGEFGHVNTYDNEIICHCGKKGCLETEASGMAFHRILLERIKNGENSILSEQIKANKEITLNQLIDATLREDMLCIEIIEEIGEKLGKQISGLINIFNPELVIIGGALAQTGDYITQPIITSVRKYSLNLVNKDSKITSSKLLDRAGVIGSCMLARSRVFEID